MKLKIGLIGIIQGELKKDYWGTMKRVAEMGYRAIESPAVPQGMDPDEFRKRLSGVGLEIPITGTSVEALNRDFGAEVARIRALKCPRAVVYWMNCDSADEWLKGSAELARLGALLNSEGIRLCYHNHEHEFKKVYDGKSAMEIIVENSDPRNLAMELDVGWVMMGGVNPAEWVSRLKGRVPVLHLKDFYDLEKRNSFTELGTGLNDFTPVFQAASESGVDWGIVEQDEMRSLSPMESVKASISHLRKLGLAA